MKIKQAAAVLLLAAPVPGCAGGTPFEPEMCVLVMEADSLTVTITDHMLKVCALPVIETQAE